MRTTFQQRLDGLEAKLGQMGQVLRSQLDRTLIALATADEDVADEVIRRDQLLDADYVEVEEEILRTLALEAPVAADLRLVAGVLHVNSHIERMGDLCVNMARFVKLAGHDQPDPEIQSTLAEMGEHARRMLDTALECFTNRDVELAERLPIMDQPLDELNERVFRQLENLPAERGTTTPGPWASRMVLAARYLERIGDHSVDIGEQVVFIVTGEVRELVPPKAVRAHLER